MTRVAFDDSFDPPACVLPVRIAGLDVHGPAALLRMLVDTGADCTLIPARIAKSLRLPVVDKAEIVGVGGRAIAAPVHAARIRLGNLRVLARVVALSDECLLGRDLLNRIVLHIDGPGQIVETTVRSKRPRR
ncbi:MAG TPA: retropepsin-like aspartic protease [Polyangiales bacterium]|nr:retropepsin-like aspartic protease [Polyangiales bacterium]